MEEDAEPIPSAIRFLSIDESLGLPRYLSPIPENGKVKENFQDLLIFQPETGVLELFRMTVDLIEREVASTPARSGRSSLNTSPRVQPVQSATSALTRLIDNGQSLRAKESSVANWDLRRRNNWPEVRQKMPTPIKSKGHRKDLGDK